MRIWNLIPCGSQGSHLSVSVARVFTYVWSHLTNLREPFYLTHFCSEVKDERKSSIYESHKAEFVANAIYVTSSFCRNFQMLIQFLHAACSWCLALSFNNQLLQFTGNKHGKTSLLLFVFFCNSYQSHSNPWG